MGRIEDKHKKHKDHDAPLGKVGDRDKKTNKFDIDDETIKDQENKE